MELGIFPQGLWSFSKFSDYLSDWIIPNMLKDLETVFEGGCERWVSQGMPKNGRGDFVLATALFALFDHLGAFLAESIDSSLHTRENISRTAKRLQSLKGIDLIVAHFGRNALVHGAWPQTTVLMDRETWAFGLNIFAHPDESTHRALYKREYPFPTDSGSSQEVKILKLRLNVRYLRRELEECIKNSTAFSDVDDALFERIQKIAVDSGRDPWANFFEQRNGRGSFNEPFRVAIEKQIKEQLEEAIKQGIW